MADESKLESAQDLIRFIDASPTPYHAVEEVSRRLQEAGFRELDEREEWRIEPGERAYVVRGGGSLVGFVAGTRPPAESGFTLLGAHTDSPNLRAKPSPNVVASGYHQLGVEVYGGVLLYTWLDRDLGVAGRVTTRGGKTHLVRFEDAVCRIPSLAIHLNRNVNEQGLQLNAQNHLTPMLALKHGKEDRGFLGLLADELEVKVEDIFGFDLCLYDVQGAAIGGSEGGFLFAPRLDNLASCHAGLVALLDAGEPGLATRAIALYDHEEVGSRSAAGAQSRFLVGTLSRLAEAYQGQSGQAATRALARSLMVSADMAHGVHPNFPEKHDKQHLPKLGKGPVIKLNASQAYATDAPSAAVFAEACQEAGFSPQQFVSRNDLPCGSTIGPISAARMGMRTVDVGNPMLSMHSCREMAGSSDVALMIAALTQVFRHPELPAPRD